MTPERWVRVKELFDAALEREATDRGAFVALACGEDAALRAEVDRLLKAHEQAAAIAAPSPAGPNGMAGALRPSLSGQVIGRYEVGRLVGAGGMGEVYAARDLDLGRSVALKVGLGDAGDARSRLKREAQHASQLNHPNICTIHEVGIHDDQPFIVMELVDGKPLSALIPAGGLPAEDVIRYGAQIADALAHAHRHRVTHRDLKSANVLITVEGRAKVLDFGLARRLPRETLESLSHSRESITTEGLVAGTLSVMAPEVLRGEALDERSDIWSLGVLLYEMACGQRPFRGATGFELSGAILHEPPRPLPYVTAAHLARVIHRCLEKDRRDRFQSADDVRAALEARDNGAAAEPPVRVGSGRWRAMSRRSRYAIASAIAIAAAAAPYFALRPDGDRPVAVGASGRPAIAVMHFENAGAQSQDFAWLSSGVPSMLATGLAQTRGLEIVSAGRLEQALRQNGGTLASLDRTQAAEVARRAGAGAIVVGAVFRAGSEIRIDAQVEDLASGRVLAAESVRGTDVFALVDQLASEIRDAVGFTDAHGVRSVANVSSTSLEAYRLYAEGTAAFGNARFEDAARLLRSAVAIDPSFAEAHLLLASVSGALGRRTDRQNHLQVALDNVDRLSERQRLLLDVHVARDSGDFKTARRVLDEVLVKFPDVEGAYTLALHVYRDDQTPAGTKRLLEITAAGAAALPSSSHTRNSHGYALLQAGRYADAVREFEDYARIAPREPNPHDSLGEAYLIMGEVEKAIEAQSRALAVDPTFAPSHALRAWSLAVLGRYDAALAEPVDRPHFRAMILSRAGRYREAAQVIADAQLQSTSSGDPLRTGGLRLMAALLAIERGDYTRALRDIQTAGGSFDGQPQDVPRTMRVVARSLSGLAHVRAGRLRQAVSELESQRRDYAGANHLERAWRHSLEGEIALARGDLATASSAFSAIEPPLRTFEPNLIATSVLLNDLPSRDGRARVAAARGDLAEAIAVYRGLLVYGPDDKFIAPFEPLYVLQIARLLEKKGERATARDEYRRFLTLWKGADADLPELAEARRAVARLGGERSTVYR